MVSLAQNVSAVILSGGNSSRMGTCKADLIWGEKTLLQHQVDKIKQLGITDIIISGYASHIEGTRFIEDIYLGKGPLSGIHAGLDAALHPHCLVSGIDTPLVPENAILNLIETHLKQSLPATVLAHNNNIEPIIAVYDSSLCSLAEQILSGENVSVRQLLNSGGFSRYFFEGDESLLLDCNTPVDFLKAQSFITTN